MEERDRNELNRIKQEHEKLHARVYLLGEQLKELEGRMAGRTPAPAPKPVPPVLPVLAATPPAAPAPAVAPERPASPPPLIIPELVPLAPAHTAASKTPATADAPTAREEAPLPKSEPALAVNQKPGGKDKSSLEIQFGTYWAVRVGIVMVLTALAFFGYYAYEHYIPHLGPWGKVVMLYLGSGLLLGAGAWFQRKQGQESMKNYGQVLFAGGLAAVYFTTYAAHYIPALKVIPNAIAAGSLLLGWAGVIVWLADRRKSETLSLFAIGLAYYTSVITNIGRFTLYSNLVLTLAAVFFLVRNRWAKLSFASLVATYAGYAYWRFYQNGAWLLPFSPSAEDLWVGIWFLAGYWTAFTAAVFLSRHDSLAKGNRATFLSLNNGAFFALVVLTMIHAQRGAFWKFSLGFGLVLLALAWLARQRLAEEPVTRNTYLAQGLLLTTIGIIAKFNGLQLALMLAAESVILLLLGCWQNNRILRVGSYLAAALALFWAMGGIHPFDQRGLWLGITVGALLAFDAVWAHRHEPESHTQILRPRTTYFVALAGVVWWVATHANATQLYLSPVVAVEAAVLTFSIYLLRVREFAVLGQIYLLAAQVLWLFHMPGAKPAVPWWNPAAVIAITLGLSHWWQRQRVMSEALEASRFLQSLYSLAIVAVLLLWLHPHCSPGHWLAFTTLLALGLTAYGILTRFWLLALAGQICLIVSGWEFFRQIADIKPDWYLALAPIAGLVVISAGVAGWLARQTDAKSEWTESVRQTAAAYRWTALLLSLVWVHTYIPERERFWVLALAGAVVLAWSGWRRQTEGLAMSAILTTAGFGYFWTQLHGMMAIYLPNLLAILLLFVQQQAVRRLDSKARIPAEVHSTAIWLAAATLWLFVSRWVQLKSGGFYLTASWAGLAFLLFGAGFLLRERIYRWSGLTVLALALGRATFIDVWKLETLYQILSFLALGIVLLLVGFIYTRYQEKIREWL